MKKMMLAVLLLGGVGALVYWTWPELQREIKIWKM